MKLLNDIKGVFVQPKKQYYFGKLAHGTPYFYPMNFSSSIIKIRELKFKPIEQITKYEKEYSHLVKYNKTYKFANIPMVRRTKDWIFKLFNNWYWVQIGWPIYIYWNKLGWKDKYETPRFEWCPAFYIFFFNIQFCIWWTAPDGNNDQYYEQILWWKNYCNKDIKLAETSWGWNNYYTKESTWNKKYLINEKTNL